MNLEFKPGTRQQFAVQAYLESQRAWLTITAPDTDLGNLQVSAVTFATEVGVPTRIKEVSSTSLDYITYVRRNRAIFEPDGYMKKYREIGAVPASHQIKRDASATEQHQALEDFG